MVFLSYCCPLIEKIFLVISVNGLPRPLEGDDVKHIRKELQGIRDRVNMLLDSLEPPPAPAVQNGEIDKGELYFVDRENCHFSRILYDNWARCGQDKEIRNSPISD